MRYQTIIFDLDGTLLNTLDDLKDSINQMLELNGWPLRTADDIKEYIGNGAKTLVRKALPEGSPDEDVERCLSVYREIYHRNMFLKTKPYAGIDETLNMLKNMGVKIGVVSNKPDDATREMCRVYFGGILDAVTGDSPERKKKPAPDNILAVMQELGAEKETTLYVGDSDVDVITAKNAGLDCAGVSWGYRPKELLIEHGADYLVDEAQQLIGLIEYGKDQKRGEKA